MARPKARTADLSRLTDLTGPIDGGTLGNRIVEVLEQSILSGDLKPGERVSADSLAEHFGVSRVPVREAFRSLEAEGWIKQIPRQGYYVEENSPTLMVDMFEARLLLEPSTAMLAAERRTREDLREMGAILARSQKEAKRQDVGALSRSNQDFHAVIARATRNAILEPILIRLGKGVRFYTIRVDSRRYPAQQEHEQILEAIRAQDGRLASRLAAEHVMATRVALDTELLRSKAETTELLLSAAQG